MENIDVIHRAIANLRVLTTNEMKTAKNSVVKNYLELTCKSLDEAEHYAFMARYPDKLIKQKEEKK